MPSANIHPSVASAIASDEVMVAVISAISASWPNASSQSAFLRQALSPALQVMALRCLVPWSSRTAGPVPAANLHPFCKRYRQRYRQQGQR